MTDRSVTLAAIIGAHGIAGEVRLKVFADDLTSYKSFNGGALTLKTARPGSNGTIARFAEISDRNAAEALRGTQLTVPRSALPPLADGEYYHVDILGLAAVSDAGDALGKVIAIDNYGAGDVLEVERPDGKRFMVPMQPEAVLEWDDTRLVITAGFAE
ncbi:ribosome maturation factor RimM [Sphingomonas sp. LM7]|uniref:ribosome maturation factor RimM n=1 Tax=Sphingomonas sp. LM7 TaxID=1938607 RepID=UPI000983C6B2|nr:ribosome maturation factor RimM [Sphingomonas sp. LM7]AQR72597.1 16S rRNA processing protein RimM [Sphingomonas sp. LM7]